MVRYIRQPTIWDLYAPLDRWLLRWIIWFRASRTRTWPHTEAVITEAAVRALEDEDGKHLFWKPKFRYKYQVNGTVYFGRSSGEIWDYEEAAAYETVESLKGNKIPIRYKSDDPSRSIYIPTDGAPPQLFPAHPDPKSGLVIVRLK